MHQLYFGTRRQIRKTEVEQHYWDRGCSYYKRMQAQTTKTVMDLAVLPAL